MYYLTGGISVTFRKKPLGISNINLSYITLNLCFVCILYLEIFLDAEITYYETSDTALIFIYNTNILLKNAVNFG